MPLDLNFSGVPREGGWEPLPEGDYIYMIQDAVLEPSKSGSPHPNLVLTLEVVEPVEFNGKTTKQWLSTHPNALWSLRLFLEAITGDTIEEGFQLDESALPGNKVGGTTVIDPDKNDPSKKYNRVAAWFEV